MSEEMDEDVKRPKVMSLVCTCGACPTQLEGTTADGRRIYVRYRLGYLRCDIDGETVYGEQLGDSLDGCIEREVIERRLKDVLEF